MKTDVSFIGSRGFFSNYGGVENAVREISKRIAQKGAVVDVYGAEFNNENVVAHSDTLPSNLRSISAPKPYYKYLGQYGQTFYAVMHTLFVGRPKVVMLFASGPCVFTPILRMGGINVVSNLRAIDSSRDKWGFFSRTILRMGEYFAWKWANEFTVNSKEMYDYYMESNNNVKYIPNGALKAEPHVDAESILNSYNLVSDQYYLFAARLDPVKRLHVLIEAHLSLPAASRFPLVIAGGHSKDASYEDRLKKMSDEKIIFIGHIDQKKLAPLMLNCRIFLLPSVLEGMSNSLLTAMASSRAVLVADVKANSEVVGNEQKALFNADDVRDLADTMNELSVDEKMRSSLAEKMKLICDQKYDWSITADSFYGLCERYLRN